MKEVGRLSLEGQHFVAKSTGYGGTHRPAPMSAFDAFFHLALIVTLRGTRRAVDYYRQGAGSRKCGIGWPDGVSRRGK